MWCGKSTPLGSLSGSDATGNPKGFFIFSGGLRNLIELFGFEIFAAKQHFLPLTIRPALQKEGGTP
jgi:hypothetical protein